MPKESLKHENQSPQMIRRFWKKIKTELKLCDCVTMVAENIVMISPTVAELKG